MSFAGPISGQHQARRYIGLELAGAKNQKTSLATVEFYPKENKVFLLDVYDRISPHEEQTGDDALLEVISEIKPGLMKMGVNVPLTLPPCLHCTRKTCPLPSKCSVPAVKWMRKFSKKQARNHRTHGRALNFTPYTQRPIELWVRHQVFLGIQEAIQFEVDETFGGNRAPLTARMNFLLRHLGDTPTIEVWPKLTVALLAPQLGVEKRVISQYRHLETGAHARMLILESLAERRGVFIYERDLRKISQSLTAFDAFICAYTAMLSDTELCAKPASGFPQGSGWVEYPIINSK